MLGSSDTYSHGAWDHRNAVLEGKYAIHRDAQGNPLNDHAGEAAFRCTTPSFGGNPTTTSIQCWLMPNMPYHVWCAIATDQHRWQRYDSIRPHGHPRVLLPSGYLRVSIYEIVESAWLTFPEPYTPDATF
jgi:hypothetical protein